MTAYAQSELMYGRECACAAEFVLRCAVLCNDLSVHPAAATLLLIISHVEIGNATSIWNGMSRAGAHVQRADATSPHSGPEPFQNSHAFARLACDRISRTGYTQGRPPSQAHACAFSPLEAHTQASNRAYGA